MSLRTETALTLKIATWNLARPVNPQGVRGARIRDWLHTIDADVWVLIETHDGVTPGPGYSCASSAEPDRASTSGERWVSIWSRYPIEQLPPTRDPARTVAARVMHPGAGAFLVYGTVLPWLGSTWRDYPARGGVAFRAALDAQVADWVDLRALFPADELFVLGDLNQDLVETHYYGSRANREALRRALATADLVALTAGESDPVRREAAPYACIDHVCLSKESRWCPGAPTRWPQGSTPHPRLSDHFGIAVTLGRREPEDA